MSSPRKRPGHTTEAPPTTASLCRSLFLAAALFSRSGSGSTTTTATAAATTATTATTTPTVTLPSQVLQAVPACATDCVATFVGDNYHDSTPSFASLCAHTGANGFTLGEAALACLVLEAASGACPSSSSADAAAREKAYLLCPSVASVDSSLTVLAAPQTHSLLVATAVVGIAFAPRPTTTTTTTTTRTSSTSTSISIDLSRTTTLSSFSSLPTTLITASLPSITTSLPSITASLPTTPITTPSSDRSSPAISAPSTPTPAPAPSARRLSTAQIVGISVGSVAVLLLALGTCIGLRALRRRRDRESEFFGDMGTAPPGSRRHGSDSLRRLRATQPQPGLVSGSNDRRSMQISAPMHLQVPARRPAQDQNQPMASVARNPYAQQTPYTLPRIRPVNGDGIVMMPTYSQPAAPRVLTTKALPARPSPPLLRVPVQQRQQQQQQQPVLPADWRPQQPNQIETNNDDVLPQTRFFGPPVTTRDSVVTEFAEDGEDGYSLGTSGRGSGRGSGPEPQYQVPAPLTFQPRPRQQWQRINV